MKNMSVLVTDYVHPLLLGGLGRLGYRTTYAPEMSRQEMVSVLSAYAGVVINTRCAIDGQMMQNAPDLRWIARLGSGLDIIDLDTAANRKIHVLSAPDGNAQAVAEHAMGMLLALSNNLVRADRAIRDGEWLREENRGWEVEGKTIGIIGNGNNGSAFARLWKGWKVKVMVHDKFLNDFGNDDILESTLQDVLAKSDILSLHIPLNDCTNNWVDQSFLDQCKPGVVLINTSRGKIVDLDALVNSLQSGQVKGACLDVFPSEPLSKSPDSLQPTVHALLQMDNVILSPHIAGWSTESFQKISTILLEKIEALQE